MNEVVKPLDWRGPGLASSVPLRARALIYGEAMAEQAQKFGGSTVRGDGYISRYRFS